MIVYKYGARLMDHEQDVEDQLRRAHRYYNLLVELARARANAASAILDVYTADALGAARALDPESSPKAERQAAWAHLKAQRREAAAGVAKPELEAAEERYRDMVRRCRGVCGAYWGTYLQIEQAAQQATKDASGRPHFRRWDRSGLIAVQLQQGASAAELMDGDTRAQITVTDRPYGGGAGRVMAEVKLRIGSVGRAPIFATFDVRYHRQIGAQDRIKWVIAKREPVGPRTRWTVAFVCETPPLATTPASEFARLPRCGLDVGWRRLADGHVRVGYLADSLGRREEIRLDPRVESLNTRAAELDGEADDQLNRLREEHTDVRWPTNRERLLTLVERLKAEGTVPVLALTWRALLRQAAEHRRRAQNIRLEQYRLLAAQLASRYGVVAIEDDSGLVAFGQETDDEAPSRHHERVLLRWAAPGELVHWLRNAGRSRSRVVLEAPAKDTTRRCCVCGHVNDWPDEVRRELVVTCEACANAIDQDEQAAVNLLGAASAHVVMTAAASPDAGLSERQRRLRGGARKRIDNVVKVQDV